MGEVKQLIDLPWTKHIVKNGSREHVTVFGTLEHDGTVLPITWCSAPFCEGNEAMVEWLVGKGVDPLVAQPPPKLAEAIRALSRHDRSGE